MCGDRRKKRWICSWMDGNEFLHATTFAFGDVDGAIARHGDIVTELKLTGLIAIRAEGGEDMALWIKFPHLRPASLAGDLVPAVDEEDVVIRADAHAVGATDLRAFPLGEKFACG